MRIKTICSLKTRKAMACAVYETAPTSLEWKLQLAARLTREKTWYAIPDWDVSLFSHVEKVIRDIWLVYIGLRTKIYSAAFQSVNLSMYIIKVLNTGNCMPYSLISVWVLSRPLLTITSKMQEPGPTVYSPYSRRPQRLTIWRYNYKGNTFSSVISRPWV